MNLLLLAIIALPQQQAADSLPAATRDPQAMPDSATAVAQLGAAGDSTTAIEIVANVSRDTVLIGEPFDLTVELKGFGSDGDVTFPVLDEGERFVSLGPPQPLGDLPEGRAAARYRLVAWEPGEVALVGDSIVLHDPGAGELTVAWPVARIFVASVLPEGAAAESLTWRPPAGVIGPNWSVQERALGGFLLLAAIALIVVYARRRAGRASPVPVPEPESPRDRALRALADLDRSNLIEAGELKAFYSGLSDALRFFLAESVPRWGRDLTTTELMRLIGSDGIDEGAAGVLEDVLSRSDEVKFARLRPPGQTALRDIAATRLWILKFEPPPEPAAEEAVDEGRDAGLMSEMDSLFADVDESEREGEGEVAATAANPGSAGAREAKDGAEGESGGTTDR